LQLPELHLNTTAFLCIEEVRASGAVPVPKATVFFVMDREGDPPYPIWVVTARHCIAEARADGRPMSIRVNTASGIRDIPTQPDDWHEADDADVAVALYNPLPGGPEDAHLEGPVFTAIPLDQFVWDDYRYRGSKDFAPSGPLTSEGQPIRAGHEVFFVGLFSQHAGKARNLPIARFGAVSRLPIEPVSVKRLGGRVEAIEGYLVEARSWGGHSGSPVFWYYPATNVVFVDPPPDGTPPPNRAARRRGQVAPPPRIPISSESGVVALLGVVSAHFDIPQPAQTEGDVIGRIVTPLNAGIAVVTPAHEIKALLKREDVVAEREHYRNAGEDEPAATYDVVSNDDASDFERFEDLTRKLVNTPKPEKDKDE
jgi:hypothetical protein